MNKNLLRQKLLNVRRSLSSQEIEKNSDKIKEILFSLSLFKEIEVILFYTSLTNEVQTYRMIEDALIGGKRVVVPVVDSIRERIIPFEIRNPRCRLVPGFLGILEPQESERYPISLQEIEMVIVPGVAFDLKGGRLGFGKGFYDRFLNKLSSQVKFVALAFECQIVEEIPCEKHDIAVNYVITEKRLICCQK